MARKTLSINQQPQYGDKVSLERLAKGQTVTPMSNAPIPAPEAGRPVGGQPQVNPMGGVPGEHQGMMAEVASRVRDLMYFHAVNEALDDDTTRLFLADAERAFQEVSTRLKTGTPDWDLNA